MASSAAVSQPRFVPHGQTVRIPAAAGTKVSVEAGYLWVTQENDPRDIVLGPGQQLRLARPGTAVLQAITGPARVRIALPQEAPATRPAASPSMARVASGVWLLWRRARGAVVRAVRTGTDVLEHRAASGIQAL